MNSWYKFQQSGVKFILISLRYGKESDIELEWKKHTNKILRDHSDRYAIILTHEAHPMHRKYACKHTNVQLILQGHRHGGRKRELMKCPNGHKIQRFIFAFRHHNPDWIQEAAAARFFTFKLGQDRVVMKTYSSSVGDWLEDTSACKKYEEGRHCDKYAWDEKFIAAK